MGYVNSTFSIRIKAYMRFNGISQVRLAETLNIPLSTLNGYLNGTREPSIETIKDLAECVNCTLDYLFDIPAVPPLNPIAYRKDKDFILEKISKELSIDTVILEGWLEDQVYFSEDLLKKISKITLIPYSILLKTNPYIYLTNSFDNFIVGLPQLNDKQIILLQKAIDYEIAKRKYENDNHKKKH